MNRIGKGIFLAQIFFLIFLKTILAQDLIWEDVSRGITNVRRILISSQNNNIIFIGTEKEIFKTKNRGKDWRINLSIKGKPGTINAIFESGPDTIYVACGDGLYLSNDCGRNWRKIFRGRGEEESYSNSIYVVEGKVIYLGTDAGLFISTDLGKTWQKIGGKLKNLPIIAIEYDKNDKIIYVAASDGLYMNKINQSYLFEKIFSVSNYAEENESSQSNGSDPSLIRVVKNIANDYNNPGIIYLATDFGIYKGEDRGQNWSLLSNSGLSSKKINFLASSYSGNLYAVAKNEIFIFKSGFWKKISSRLPVKRIHFITINNNVLYAATDKGIFKTYLDKKNQYSFCEPKYIKNEPTIRQLHQAAIKYNKIIDPKQIESHRWNARLQALLPDLNIDYDKTISSYSNSSQTRFTIGPGDWGVSIKWNLGDLVWSEQQRLIDSQVRLLVQLRNDILDEINKLYFERIRLKMEIDSKTLTQQEKIYKKLKIAELDASLDALTGGYFSQYLSEKRAVFNFFQAN